MLRNGCNKYNGLDPGNRGRGSAIVTKMHMLRWMFQLPSYMKE